MKYTTLLCFLFIGSYTFAQLGIEVGYSSGNAKVESGILSVKSSSNSTSIGLAYDAMLSETLDLQPSISFAIGEKVENKSNNAIGLGIGLHYYFNNREGGFYAGPILSYSNSLADVDTDVISKGVFGSGLVLGYDVSEQFTLMAGYGFSLSNPSKVDGVDVSANSIGIAVQYFFR